MSDSLGWDFGQRRDAYLVGMRVSLRLRVIRTATAGLLALTVVSALGIAYYTWPLAAPPDAPEMARFFAWQASLLLFCMALIWSGVRVLSVACGWLTVQQARDFPFEPRHPYPGSWLEPDGGGIAGRAATPENCEASLRAAVALEAMAEWDLAIEHYRFVIRSALNDEQVPYAANCVRRLEGLQSLQPPPGARSRQFSLRWLFLLLTGAAVVCAVAGVVEEFGPALLIAAGFLGLWSLVRWLTDVYFATKERSGNCGAGAARL